MKTSLKVIACMAVLAILLTAQFAVVQDKKAVPGKVVAQGKLEGVWRVSEVWVGDPDKGKITVGPTHPSLIIFTKKHFSFINIKTVNGTRPGLPQKGATDAQKLEAWTPIAAFSGSYEMNGNIGTFHNIVDMDPNGMSPGNFGTTEIKIEGDELITTPKTDQNGPIANPLVTKFIRVE